MWDLAYHFGLICLSIGFCSLAMNLKFASFIRGKSWLIAVFLVSSLWCISLLGQGLFHNPIMGVIATSCQICTPALLAVFLLHSRNLNPTRSMIAILLPLAPGLGAIWQTRMEQLNPLSSMHTLSTPDQWIQWGLWTWILGLGLWNLAQIRPTKKNGTAGLLLLAALCAPVAAQAFELLIGTETPNPTPLAPLGLALSLLCLALFPSKKHIQGLGPLSRGAVMDQLDLGIAILSTSGRILDCTPQARKMLAPFMEHSPTRKPLHERLEWLPDLKLLNEEIHGAVEHGKQTMEYQIQPIFSALNQHEGWILSLRDISSECDERKHLTNLAYTDALTGLANRSNFMQTLENELQRFQRYGQNFALLLMDLDHFKKINDTYGHLAGDECLRHFSRLSQQFLREVDVIGRLGGEEFGALLPLADSNSAYAAAERLRRQIEQHSIWFEGKEIKLTVSIGLARPVLGDEAPDQIIARADQALYSAKREGRNRILVCEESRAQDGQQDDLQIPLALS